ncbi:HAMP domain-containing sensor histidine kinase [Streptomyces sp. SM14]|uniref:ATP-binding protein n=1 Tax=Streptomyces sp. SM14 TaxID=1736045 RepID=UPI000CD4AE36
MPGPAGGAVPEGDGAGGPDGGRGRRRLRAPARLSSLRFRLVTVFALVALMAAVSVAGIAYWLNRDAVLTRAQSSALADFRKSLGDSMGSLPARPSCDELRSAAGQMAGSSQSYQVVLVMEGRDGSLCVEESDPLLFSLEVVPDSLSDAVHEVRGGDDPYHLYWQRITHQDDPYLVAGAHVRDSGPTGYMLASLVPERDDLNSLAWSLGIATGLALFGSVMLAQAAAATVLRPVQRLNSAARQLGDGELSTRLPVRGADELAELTRTFNRTAESLEHKVADLRAREASSRRFVADMSHELRTPMTAITAVTEVLEEEVDNLDPMIAPAVSLVVSETRRLNNLVENLMEVTRFDAGTARMVVDDVDIADQVTACIDARAWLDAVELDADRGVIARVDPRRLDVILANLIGNALKHGGSPVRVSVHEVEPPRPGGGATALSALDDGPVARSGDAPVRVPRDGAVLIEVTDAGPGIPEEVLPHVFDRFYKASASRPRSEGSGLGLSIALENAHLHGGEITARNSADGGAVFSLLLPHRPAGADGEDPEDGEDGVDPDDGQRDGPPGQAAQGTNTAGSDVDDTDHIADGPDSGRGGR